MKYFENLKKEDNDSLEFNIQNVSHAMVNSLRRVILSEIKTIKFRTEPYERSDVFIRTNNSCKYP